MQSKIELFPLIYIYFEDAARKAGVFDNVIKSRSKWKKEQGWKRNTGFEGFVERNMPDLKRWIIRGLYQIDTGERTSQRLYEHPILNDKVETGGRNLSGGLRQVI